MDHERSQQLAGLAVRIGLLHRDQLQSLHQESAAGIDLVERMTARGWLRQADIDHLAYLLERCLPQQPEWVFPTLKPNEAAEAWDVTPPPPIHTPREAIEAASDRAALAEFAPAPGAPAAAGRFRIAKLHATGGIGRVWIARDESLGRDVALKDLRPESGHAAHQLRFVDEAKITARLEHPGIVPVYELARRADDGQPYYVMRFVKGQTLQEAIGRYHVAKEPVAFQRLMQAFRAIGQTLAYAHAQGVLHRDLKPANILLGDFGEVLVLDWGLAKTSASQQAYGCHPDGGRAGSAASSSATRAGEILGTPAYMSPEQAVGNIDAIDARSDVWGLGAILYEILTGVQPFRGASVLEVLNKVKNAAPDRPRSRNRDIPAALEAICLKALAKDPVQRYASATEMVDDVNRWLADEPVGALREPITQRLARWARRHRTLVTTASALLITAVAALTISAILIDRQRARAETNLQTALDAVETFYVQVSENRLLNEPGMQPLRADLLGKAIEFCERFASENHGDPLRHADLARMQLLLGQVQAKIDAAERALESLERARTMYADLRQHSPNHSEWIRGIARADLNIGVLLHETEPKRARQSYEAAIAGFDRLTQSSAAIPSDQEKLARAHNNLGHWLKQHERFDAALTEYHTALAQIEALAKAAPDNRGYRLDRAGFHANIGVCLKDHKKPAEARAHFEQALVLLDELALGNVKDLALDEDRALPHVNLGNLYMMEKNSPAAEKHFRAALRYRQLLVQRNPTVHQFRDKLGWDHANLSYALVRLEQTEAALAENAKALEVFESLQKEFPKQTKYLESLAKNQLNQGYILLDAKRPKEAVTALTRAIFWLGASRAVDEPWGKPAMRDAYWTRAMAYNESAGFAQAVADYDLALQLDDGTNRKDLEAERAKTLARIKE